jgi:hypothetical protein
MQAPTPSDEMPELEEFCNDLDHTQSAKAGDNLELYGKITLGDLKELAIKRMQIYICSSYAVYMNQLEKQNPKSNLWDQMLTTVVKILADAVSEKVTAISTFEGLDQLCTVAAVMCQPTKLMDVLEFLQDVPSLHERMRAVMYVYPENGFPMEERAEIMYAGKIHGLLNKYLDWIQTMPRPILIGRSTASSPVNWEDVTNSVRALSLEVKDLVNGSIKISDPRSPKCEKEKMG